MLVRVSTNFFSDSVLAVGQNEQSEPQDPENTADVVEKTANQTWSPVQGKANTLLLHYFSLRYMRLQYRVFCFFSLDRGYYILNVFSKSTKTFM